MRNPENAQRSCALCWVLIVPRLNWRLNNPQGVTMAKGQQKSNKESKKPRKDTSPPKTIAVDTERPIQKTTTIIPRGKKPV
jgi:hypothetical protein